MDPLGFRLSAGLFDPGGFNRWKADCDPGGLKFGLIALVLTPRAALGPLREPSEPDGLKDPPLLPV
jgi:hypothetical protein